MRTCKLCGLPLTSMEDLARALLVVEDGLDGVPRRDDGELLPDLLGYLDEEIRPRILAIAAELLGVHFPCRLKEAAGQLGAAVDLSPTAAFAGRKGTKRGEAR